MENYLYLNGKRYELSNKTVKQIKKDIIEKYDIDSVPIKTLKGLLKDNGLLECFDFNEIKMTEDSEIHIPLPCANKEWTFGVYEAAKKFCEIYPGSYPRHNPKSWTTFIIFFK